MHTLSGEGSGEGGEGGEGFGAFWGLIMSKEPTVRVNSENPVWGPSHQWYGRVSPVRQIRLTGETPDLSHIIWQIDDSIDDDWWPTYISSWMDAF